MKPRATKPLLRLSCGFAGYASAARGCLQCYGLCAAPLPSLSGNRHVDNRSWAERLSAMPPKPSCTSNPR
jgi:hypothetical protein